MGGEGSLRMVGAFTAQADFPPAKILQKGSHFSATRLRARLWILPRTRRPSSTWRGCPKPGSGWPC
ncbi:hypothetical protein MES4922_170057 [Mesorhizobium ventifaucium]|uniref:Uncharacterized protein n=1 Tax=Mesorhizobium ventifaucium TaxID=666020 RepID=A0ABM9DJ68_9HYPH|nr:hypothetical protein MES4922_170057 [Mesorhizobium ventifaucium]